MTEPFQFRSPTPADVPHLVDLLNACDEADVGSPNSDEEDATWRWRIPGFDGDRDAWVLEGEGGLAAFAAVYDAEAEVFVHPAQRGRGIGSSLLRIVEERALEQSGDGVELKQNVTNRADAARALLEAAGYAKSHYYSRLEMELPTDPPTPSPIEGVTIRRVDPDKDARALYDAYCAAWQQYEGQEWTPEGFEEWSSVELQGTDFDPALILLAEEDDRIVGFVIAYDHPGNKGWVGRLGTLPEHRGRGIGRALMLAIEKVVRGRGATHLALAVSSRNVSSARKLYESLGMTEILRYDNYRKKLFSR